MVRRSFSIGAQRQSGSQTTARELAQELASFARSIKQSAEKLGEEIRNMETAKAQLSAERADAAKRFVESTLTDLNGAELGVIDEIALNVPELGTRSLSFYRNELLSERNAALTSAGALLNGTVDVEGFQTALKDAQRKYETELAEAQAEQTKAETAKAQLAHWKTKPEYTLVELDEEIAAKGGVRLTPDNRAIYEPTGWLSAVSRYLTEGADYRKVRDALTEYGHGTNGKDAFADLSTFKTATGELENQRQAAEEAYRKEKAESDAAQRLASQLSRIAPQVEPDAQILAKVQRHVVGCLATPQFAEALASHYAEDFPRSFGLVTAKITALDKLKTGVEAKLEQVNANYAAVITQQRKLASVAPYRTVNADLGEVRKRNAARRYEYDTYARTAGSSWRRARDYQPDRTIVIDNSPSYLDMLIMHEILCDHHGHTYDQGSRQGVFTPDRDAAYTADLLGVTKDNADQYGLPGAVFDISPETSQELADLGVEADDYQVGAVFDIENPDSANNDTVFDIQAEPEDERPQRGSFSIGGNDDSPSSSGRSFGIGSSSRNDDDDNDRRSNGDSFSIGSPSFGGSSVGS